MSLLSTTPQPDESAPVVARSYESPGFELISLDCEISAYAPDGDDERPLF